MRKIIFILIFLLLVQLVYSFLFPAVGSNDNWLPISNYLTKFKAGETDNLILNKVYPLISKNYRLPSDVGNYLELALNFNKEQFQSSVFLERPLYPFLVFLTSLPLRLVFAPSYGIVFGSAILLNFLMITLAVLLFFFILNKLFSLKIAFLSSLLLIFSPAVHISLIQPLAEMLMIFAVAVTAHFLYDYAKKPSFPKLLIYSLIIGMFLLGKMFFAITLFILLLALYLKRYREGAIFFLIHLIPYLFWYFWVTRVWDIPFYVNQVQQWGAGVWLADLSKMASPLNFFWAIIYGFLAIPLVFSIIGYRYLPFKNKRLIYFGSFVSFFAMGFILNLYLKYHAFLLFPIIYPTCVLGIEVTAQKFKKYHRLFYPLTYAILIGTIIIASSVNIFKLFDWFGI